MRHKNLLATGACHLELRTSVERFAFSSTIVLALLSLCCAPPTPEEVSAARRRVAAIPTGSPVASASRAVNPEFGSRWEYSTFKDEMSGKESPYAVLTSQNEVEFGFPYSGTQKGTLLVNRDSVLFYVRRGHVVCQGLSKYGTCVVRVKFDDEEPKFVTARESGNENTTIAFTENGFLARLQKSNTFAVSPEVYDNGYPVFRFKTTGLNRNLRRE
jgi:hypothetical protein